MSAKLAHGKHLDTPPLHMSWKTICLVGATHVIMYGFSNADGNRLA